MSSAAVRNVVVDVDVGSDDAWAILMLLRAQELNLINLLGITCVKGNSTVDNVAKNTLRVLSSFESISPLKPPVFLGAANEMIVLGKRPFDDEATFHGRDGLGDLEDYSEDGSDTKNLAKEHAVNALERIVMENPKQVSLICLGPLTNLGLCLRMYPHVAENIGEVYIMGGNHLGVGNITSSAEFNFFNDPEAAQIALDALKCPIFLLPWESCLEDKFFITMDWRMNVLGEITNRITRFMNPIEEKCYREYSEWMPCDALLTATFLTRNTIVEKSSIWHATVELSGYHTRGQLILDHLRKKIPNLTILEKVNQVTFMEMMLWTAGHEIDVKKFLPRS
ncbi:nucleoside hydrolase-like [Phlebotomus argentipes]|uniref:nucleoside hydrolase-like n=1 Tax=Phlebotomus argentipes TaxID=94469 RepID=UPI002893696D|nr:nucleoside hydrolase-like [Phlebotomus argentipes]